MTEKPAQGVKGFILWSPLTEDYFFRIYDPVNKRNFTDYELHSQEIEVEILGNYLSLYEGEDHNSLDFTSKVLGKKP